jgi:signal transduction histidine kinase
LKGRLLAHNRREIGGTVEEVLLLQSGNTTYEALWATHATNRLADLPRDAMVKVKGLCLTQLSELDKAPSFRLLVRDPAELQVLDGPRRGPHGQSIASFGLRLCSGRRRSVRFGCCVERWSNARPICCEPMHNFKPEITERRRAQADLGRALLTERQLGELKSRFVSMVSHEFRTPWELSCPQPKSFKPTRTGWHRTNGANTSMISFNPAAGWVI